MSRDEIALKILLATIENAALFTRVMAPMAHPATGTFTVVEMHRALAGHAWNLAEAFIDAGVPVMQSHMDRVPRAVAAVEAEIRKP